MQVGLIHDAPDHVRAGALVVPFFSDSPLEGTSAEVTPRLAVRSPMRSRAKKLPDASARTFSSMQKVNPTAGSSPFPSANARGSNPAFSPATPEAPFAIWGGATSKR